MRETGDVREDGFCVKSLLSSSPRKPALALEGRCVMAATGIALRRWWGGGTPAAAGYTSSVALTGDTFLSRGRLLLDCTQPSVPHPAPQREPPPAGGLPLVFSAEKTASPAGVTTQLPQFGRLGRRSRSRVKRAEKEAESRKASSLAHSVLSASFSQ